MATDLTNQLEAFLRFLGEHLANGGSSLTPEECLALWRAQHSTPEQLSANMQAVREALADMDASDAGQPLEQFLAEFRRRNHLST